MVSACSASQPGIGGMIAALGGTSSGAAQGVGPGTNAGGLGANPVPIADAAEDGARLKVTYNTDATGLKLPTGELWDSALGTECYAGKLADGINYCLPSLKAFRSWAAFADATCTVPAGQSYADCGAPLFVTQQLELNSCAFAPTVRIFHAGQLTPAIFQKDSGGKCTEFISAGYVYYLLGAEMSPSEFAPMTTTHG